MILQFPHFSKGKIHRENKKLMNPENRLVYVDIQLYIIREIVKPPAVALLLEKFK